MTHTAGRGPGGGPSGAAQGTAARRADAPAAGSRHRRPRHLRGRRGGPLPAGRRLPGRPRGAERRRRLRGRPAQAGPRRGAGGPLARRARADGPGQRRRARERGHRPGRLMGTLEVLSPGAVVLVGGGPGDAGLMTVAGRAAVEQADVLLVDHLAPAGALEWAAPGAEIVDVSKMPRSEEHTSELQSRENLVCRLLLEKKKK